MNNLNVGQKLISTEFPQYGEWIITEISKDFDGDIIYTIKGFSGERILFASEITRGFFKLI